MIELQSGNLNVVSLIEGEDNRLWVLRSPQSKIRVDKTVNQVKSEHLAEGFLENPDNFIHIRSLTEQVLIANRLKEINILTPNVVLKNEQEQLIEYIPQTEKLFDLWLKSDPRVLTATPKTFDLLIKAHQSNLILGDRTGKNELVAPNGDVYLIDFDIELSGPDARIFDFSTLIYRLSRAAHRGSPKQLPALGEIYKDVLLNQRVRTLYDRDILLKYMQRYVYLSTEEGAKKLSGMTPIIKPEYSAELFNFLIDVLKFKP